MREFYRSLLKDVVGLGLEHFQSNLMASRPVRELLMNAGVAEGVIKRFGVGYARPGWTDFTELLAEMEDYYRDCARTLGLVSKGKRGFYDYFRNRVVVPVRDDSGDPVGFTARTLQSLRKKYRPKKFDKRLLNSTHSPIFDKRNHLVGFNEARNRILETRQVLVTLDPVELLVLHSEGLTNAVMELIPGGFDEPESSSQHQWLLEVSESLDVLKTGG